MAHTASNGGEVVKRLPEQSLANLTLTELMERCSYAQDRASFAAREWNDRLRRNHQRVVAAAMRDGYELRPEVEKRKL